MMKYSDGPIAISMGVLWDYVVLTAMLIIMSLPIVTIGCTFHATLRIVNKFRLDGHSQNVSLMFLKYLKEQWVWYTLTFMIGGISVATSLVNLRNLIGTSTDNIVLGSLMSVLAILVVCIWFCIQVVGIFVRIKPVEFLKVSLIFFALNLPRNLGIFIVTVVLCYVLAILPLSFLIILILLDFIWKRFLCSAQAYVSQAQQVVKNG